MTVAFAVGALASGFVGAGLTAGVVWIATLVGGSPEPWTVAPLLVVGAALVVTVATYVAEGAAYRRTLARMRATGEPWAYRDR